MWWHIFSPTMCWHSTLSNYAILGEYDYLDIFNAPDIDTAMKVATIIRTFGHAHTEVLAAKEWRQYKEMIRNIPGTPA